MNDEKLEKELAGLLNGYSLENESNTPGLHSRAVHAALPRGLQHGDAATRDVVRAGRGPDCGDSMSYAITEAVLFEIEEEFKRAERKHPEFPATAHHGYAVILEEVDELWDAIKRHDGEGARKECVQVAAMCLRFLNNVKNFQ